MYDIVNEPMTPEFLECWRAAAMHLDRQVPGGMQSWMRSHPFPPYLEHLSFRIGNQLYFVRVEDVDEAVNGPGNTHGLRAAAEGNRGHACLMPMRKDSGGAWRPETNGWGLIDPDTGDPIDPDSLVTDEAIEMTDWEVHDFAVQVVRDHLSGAGHQLISWQSDPGIDPSIWFVGESKGPEWVVVRGVRFPEREARRPADWSELAVNLARVSRIGHFASVALVSAEQPFAHEGELPAPLHRGTGMIVRFAGLER